MCECVVAYVQSDSYHVISGHLSWKLPVCFFCHADLHLCLLSLRWFQNVPRYKDLDSSASWPPWPMHFDDLPVFENGDVQDPNRKHIPTVRIPTSGHIPKDVPHFSTFLFSDTTRLRPTVHGQDQFSGFGLRRKSPSRPVDLKPRCDMYGLVVSRETY